jgi:Helix-turn-helix domain
MVARTMISEREQQRRAEQRTKSLADAEQRRRGRQRAMSLAEFCERYGIGRTKAYEELNSGRLCGRKSGRRTIITEDDAEDWLRNLPAMEAMP